VWGVGLLVAVLVLVVMTSGVLDLRGASPGPAVSAAEPAVSPASSDRAGLVVRLRAPRVTSDRADTAVKVVVRSTKRHASGAVVLKSGSRVVARGDVASARVSKVRLRLPALSQGRHVLRALYVADGGRARTPVRSNKVVVRTLAGCAGDPSACGFPDAGTTGPRPGVGLRDVPGEVTSGKGWHYDARGFIEVDGDGAVVSGIRADVGINVEADHVVVQDVALTVDGEDFGVAIRHATDVTVQYSSITAPSASGPQRLMVGVKDVYGDSSGVVVAHNDIEHTATGVQLDRGLVEANYIHDLGYTDGDHVNGTTSNGGSELLVIRGNTVFNPHDQTDAVSLFQDFGGQANREIVGNLLAGGGYTIYGGDGAQGTTGIVVRDNRIARLYFPRGGHFGPATDWSPGPGNVWSGNVWDDTGRAVPAP
jgi:hypothetical protein